MYCPICGQQQSSDAIRFCSRCGFALSGVAEVVANNGLIPRVAASSNLKTQSPLKRGVKQGVFLMMFVLLVPVLAILSGVLNLPSILIPLFAVAPPILGLLRIVYALMFESGEPTAGEFASNDFAQKNLKSAESFVSRGLPAQPANFNAAAAYAPPAQQNVSRPNWRGADTGELVMPSVTEDTTKLLRNDEIGTRNDEQNREAKPF